MQSDRNKKESHTAPAPCDTDLQKSAITATDLHSGHVPIPDGTLFYQMRGHGEAVVFIHGFTLDSRMWAKQVEHFCQNYRTLCYDVRGFGKSSAPQGQFTHHEDLRVLLDTLQLERVHLVGFSMGGRIALNFALHYPERVESLAVFASNLEGARFDLERVTKISASRGQAKDRGARMQAQKARRRARCGTLSTFWAEDAGPRACSWP